MRSSRASLLVLGPVVSALVAMAPETAIAAAAQDKPAARTTSEFSVEQLEQIAAPIALYPDSLLMQMCMAATYPLEVVQAARFVERSPKLAGKELEAALKEKDWDPSVKSLCGFKSVLKQMNDNLDWTQDLGDAFLGQQPALLDAVQRLRGQAREAGALKTNEQQTVTVQEDKTIIIEPATQVVYVPTYSPAVVYGPAWGYPAYYYPAVYPAGAMALSFTAGVVVGGAMWGGCHWGWGHSEVDIDVDHHYDFNRNTSIDADRNRVRATEAGGRTTQWKHDPGHRKGVGYRDSATAQRYGGARGSTRVTRDQARGFDRGPSASTRPSAGRPSAGRPSSGRTAAGASRPETSPTRSSYPSSGRSTAYSGSRQPQLDRAASRRGSVSRGYASRGGGRGGGGRRR